MKRKIWTQEEIEYLINNYSKYTNPQLAKHLDRTVGSIERKAGFLNLKKDDDFSLKVRVKDADKIEFLRNNYGKLTLKELAEQTDWTVGNVNAKLIYHGIRPKTEKSLKSVSKTKRAWTKEEESFLLNHYLHMEQQDIAKELGRTLRSIQKKMSAMNLKKYKRNENWTDEEVEYLKENYMKTPMVQQMKALGRTYSAIGYKAREIGLSRDTSTSIEREVQFILESYEIAYRSQQEIRGFIADFIIGEDKIIEVHGDYWHCNPLIYSEPKNDTQRNKIKVDKIKHRVYTELGYKVLYIWEYDLNNHFEKCVNDIIDFAVLG